MKNWNHIVKSIIICIIGLAILCFVLMWIWNALIPDLFKGPRLSYVQAVGLFVLCQILFGSRRHVDKFKRGANKEPDIELFKERTELLRAKWAQKCGHTSPKNDLEL